LLQQHIWLQQQKKLFVVPNFVAVTKPFFPVQKTPFVFAKRLFGSKELVADPWGNCGAGSKREGVGAG